MIRKTILIDPGHGGADPGAVSGSRYESHDVLRLALALEAILVQQGHRVVFTRRKDVHVPLVERGPMANTAEADAFVSLHRNSFTTGTANGVEVWVHPSAPAADTALAALILEQLTAVGVQANRGVKSGSYRVLADVKPTIPAVLVELGFITNDRDNALFDSHFDAYALAIAKGILESVGTPYAEAGGETPKLYRIQLGAFTSREHCERYLGEIQALGLPAFMVYPGLEEA